MIIDKQQPVISAKSQITSPSITDRNIYCSNQKKTFKERINQLKVKIKPSINAPVVSPKVECLVQSIKIEPNRSSQYMDIGSSLQTEVKSEREYSLQKIDLKNQAPLDNNKLQSKNISIYVEQILQKQADNKEKGKQNMVLNFQEIEDILFRNYTHNRMKSPDMKICVKAPIIKVGTDRKVRNIAIDVRQCSARTKTQSNLTWKKCSRENKSKQHTQNIINQVKAKVNANRK